MGYLICDKCGGYYEIQDGESPEDFSDECDCGGKLVYSESLESTYEDFNGLVTKITCPYCGAENPEDRTLCQSCKRFLKPIKSPSNIAKISQSYTIEPPEDQIKNESKFGTWIVAICIVGLINIIALRGPRSAVDFWLSKYLAIGAIALIILNILGLISLITKRK
jgi:hypothetical protein